ncbi:DUF3100 domain-containing protein [Herbaspirillum robiniae]|uniref:Branched-chain amino acid ABC transporter permease n=1 Tax=Herbaspirillum robiniae TaxID=2014887 RepID=A0A246WLC9_9BURK|nr:DUF3100 domain-containing protein [Herbaspirillum robiniae]NUU02752.1 DUF3100 domain-containing protein [Herbaspirillum robiniae]OWY27132.1 branched-chain amino acid ABC transporter permease [Herbaspirillum robiniae]
MQAAATSVSATRQGQQTWKLYIYAAIILVIAEWIGSATLKLGPGKIVLLPMVWALIMGAALGLFSRRLPGGMALTQPMQFQAAAILQPALLLFVAKLGLMVGNSLPKLVESGWALVFQEFGHFVGTILIGLPLALLLGIKREAIGATFSVGREPSLAIIGERYGMDSPEGRGVLAEYITGTLFGAIFIAVFAGFIASLNIFHPYSLAMGAGVGSGSMMAAAAGAIAALQPADVAKDVATFAAASNLITTTIGTYFTLFISLPLAVWGYRVLEPIIGRTNSASTPPDDGLHKETHLETAELNLAGRISAWVFAGVLTMIANWIAYKVTPLASLGCIALMVAVVFVGDQLRNLTGKKVPAVCWVTLVAMFLTSPACPWAAAIVELTAKVNFLAVITPMLTFAGLSIAKDIPAFRKLGWRIVVVSFAANAGTFIGATLIAEFFHR